MSRSDDDRSVTPRRRLSDRTADRLVRGFPVPEERELTELVTALTALVPEEPPAPSQRLAALLEQGPPASTVGVVPNYAPARRRGLLLRRLTLAATAALGLVLAAASTNALPDPAQEVVSDVVGFVTPLDLPKPQPPRPTPSTPSTPTTAPSAVPGSTPQTPLPRESAAPSPGVDEPVDEPTEPEVTPEDSAEPDPEEPTEEPTDEPTEEPAEEQAASEPDGVDPASLLRLRRGGSIGA